MTEFEDTIASLKAISKDWSFRFPETSNPAIVGIELLEIIEHQNLDDDWHHKASLFKITEKVVKRLVYRDRSLTGSAKDAQDTSTICAIGRLEQMRNESKDLPGRFSLFHSHQTNLKRRAHIQTMFTEIKLLDIDLDTSDLPKVDAATSPHPNPHGSHSSSDLNSSNGTAYVSINGNRTYIRAIGNGVRVMNAGNISSINIIDTNHGTQKSSIRILDGPMESASDQIENHLREMEVLHEPPPAYSKNM